MVKVMLVEMVVDLTKVVEEVVVQELLVLLKLDNLEVDLVEMV